jgi:type IV pilus assembly protein PilQ
MRGYRMLTRSSLSRLSSSPPVRSSVRDVLMFKESSISMRRPHELHANKERFKMVLFNMTICVSLLLASPLGWAAPTDPSNGTQGTPTSDSLHEDPRDKDTVQPSTDRGDTGSSLAQLTGPKIETSPRGYTVTFGADKPLTYTVFKLTQPTRIFIDVIDAHINQLTTPIEPTDGAITQIGALQIKERGHHIGRLMLTLDGDQAHSVKALKTGLVVIILDPRAEALPVASTLKRPAPPVAQMIDAPQPSPKTRVTSPTHKIEVKTIQFESRSRFSDRASSPRHPDFDEGETARLIVGLSGEPTVRLDDQDPRSPRILLAGVSLPSSFEKRIDTEALETPVKMISSFQNHLGGVTLEASLNREIAHQINLVGGDLIWRFYGVDPITSYEIAQSVGAPSVQASSSQSPLNPTTPQRRKKRYLGKRIKINIKDADIHNVLRFLADCGRVNIVTSDDVEGTVTLMLNQVPWDQALEIILRTKGLDMVREGNIIRVAPREAIAAERKAELEKTQIKEQLKPIMIRLITVNHAEGKDMVDQVKGVLSERGSVGFDLRTNTLIIKDVDEHIDAAEDLVRRLDTQTPQVLIEARIVEVNKVNEKELGIQWGGSFRRNVGIGNPTGLAFPSSIGVLGGADDQQVQSPGTPSVPNFMVNLPATVGAGSGGAVGLSLGNVDGSFNLNVRLSAAASRGSVKIISSPKITTLDNKQAVISQGVSIPISQISAQGVQTTFFDATLSLEVTPHVTQDGNIYLQLKANNDTPDFQNVGSRGDPTILKKQASTQVLLQDGETTVIGGIYTSNAGQGSAEWPYLAQIPILGVFFRSTSERSQRNELLIFITPRVINRLASQVNTQ